MGLVGLVEHGLVCGHDCCAVPGVSVGWCEEHGSRCGGVLGCTNETETATIAETLIDTTAKREHVKRDQLTIHSDRGAQMTSGTLTDLYDLLTTTAWRRATTKRANRLIINLMTPLRHQRLKNPSFAKHPTTT
jgi:hypothetical protein